VGLNLAKVKFLAKSTNVSPHRRCSRARRKAQLLEEDAARLATEQGLPAIRQFWFGRTL